MVKVGDSLTVPENGWQRIDDTDSSITYEGTWDVGSDSKYAEHYSNVLNDKIKFNFIGSKIRIINAVYNNRSQNIVIYIDGINCGKVMAYDTTFKYFINTFEKLDLDYCEHCVEIVNKDTGYQVLDAIDIDKQGELRPYDINVVKNAQITSKDNINIYPNIYVDKQNKIKIDVKMPVLETTVTDDINVAQSDLEDGNLFETDYFDLMKYKQINNLNFSSN
jgi:hypothetical protein